MLVDMIECLQPTNLSLDFKLARIPEQYAAEKLCFLLNKNPVYSKLFVVSKAQTPGNIT